MQIMIVKNDRKENTHDWNNDIPCEWDLETLIGQTFGGVVTQVFF